MRAAFRSPTSLPTAAVIQAVDRVGNQFGCEIVAVDRKVKRLEHAPRRRAIVPARNLFRSASRSACPGTSRIFDPGVHPAADGTASCCAGRSRQQSARDDQDGQKSRNQARRRDVFHEASLPWRIHRSTCVQCDEPWQTPSLRECAHSDSRAVANLAQARSWLTAWDRAPVMRRQGVYLPRCCTDRPDFQSRMLVHGFGPGFGGVGVILGKVTEDLGGIGQVPPGAMVA